MLFKESLGTVTQLSHCEKVYGGRWLCKYRVTFLKSCLCTKTTLHSCVCTGSSLQDILYGVDLYRQKYVKRTLWAYAKLFLCKLASEQGSSWAKWYLDKLVPVQCSSCAKWFLSRVVPVQNSFCAKKFQSKVDPVQSGSCAKWFLCINNAVQRVSWYCDTNVPLWRGLWGKMTVQIQSHFCKELSLTRSTGSSLHKVTIAQSHLCTE